jgi:hypothetical protein
VERHESAKGIKMLMVRLNGMQRYSVLTKLMVAALNPVVSAETMILARAFLS